MLHGRSGPYSSAAHGVYTAATLSGRHATWAAFWAERGYVALLVDSFGPRGYPAGFPRHSYKSRPAAVSEQTVRPLDAYGALAYLRTRPGGERQPGGAAGMVQRGDDDPGDDGGERSGPRESHAVERLPRRRSRSTRVAGWTRSSGATCRTRRS